MEYWESQEYKRRRVMELQAIRYDDYELVHDGETRLLEYVSAVRDNPDGHNLFEVLSVIRFFRLRRQYVFRWDRIDRFTALYETLKFSGLTGRRSYRLTPIQYFQFANIKGFYEWVPVEADPRETVMTESVRVLDGQVYELRRLINDALLFLPRKFSKTTSTSALAVDELLFGDNNAQCYCGANSYKQAKICFDEIVKCLRPLDPRRTRFKFTRETVKWRLGNEFGKESTAECLSGGAETKDGLNASLVIFDEYGAARYTNDHSDAAELLQVLKSSMGVRKEPLTVIITSGSRVTDGPFSVMLRTAMRVLLGEVDNDHLFAHLFMPDAWEMSADCYGDPRLWRKVNPHIGVTVQEDYYRKQWADAQEDPEVYIEFVTKFLNIFHSESVQDWISSREIECLQEDFGVEGRPDAMASIDLSVHDDFSAVGYTVYDKSRHRFLSDCVFFIPEQTLLTHPNHALYRQWVSDGWLRVCPGKVVSAEMIVADVLKHNRRMRILQIGYDRWKSQEVVNALAAVISSQGTDPDKILRAVPQTYGAFTSPVETLEFAVKRTPPSVSFSRNPIIPYCFGNCYLDEDRMGNKKPVKRKRNLKIDGVIVTLQNFWLFNNYEQQV